MIDVLYFVTNFLLQIVTFLFIARFLLQACRVDFYNPISQGIVKVTDPILKPMRMALPGYRNIDFASFLAAVLAQVIFFRCTRCGHQFKDGWRRKRTCQAKGCNATALPHHIVPPEPDKIVRPS